MKLPPDSAPLYNHPLPAIEHWLESQQCSRDREDPTRWYCERQDWRAEIEMEQTALKVSYAFSDGSSKVLTFPYALSRADVEAAAFDI
ncbi:DUF3143 domain-containing protein [Synechococcus sp. PCC 7336]|uniref:DUF3143 domain-containing protein n=1 Tax=Synechococcus sp. PCC 7336 TaxID=195250 RepID=UPI00034603A6|nr:DUF3143 domain-containing protein [Synechococcus sp. PCC 7336]